MDFSSAIFIAFEKSRPVMMFCLSVAIVLVMYPVPHPTSITLSPFFMLSIINFMYGLKPFTAASAQ